MEVESKVELELLEIKALVDQGMADQACEKYIELIQMLESKGDQVENQIKARVYAAFSYLLFALSEYDAFFEMLIKAQLNGYSKESVRSFIYEAFIEPNEATFKSIFEDNLSYFYDNKILVDKTKIKFEELPFWLIPTGIDHEYYWFDCEANEILNKISFEEQLTKELSQDTDLSSDYIIALKGDVKTIAAYAKAAHMQHKRAYFLIEDWGLFTSCLQGFELKNCLNPNAVIFKDTSDLQRYFTHQSDSLPRKVIYSETDNSGLEEILEGLHQMRITPQNRRGNQVVLSICIPTFNRGHRAFENINHLLKMKYDEEIEIVISNNGTQNETKPYYDQIKNLKDSRLTYFEFNENQGFSLNCCKVCELAKGKYMLLISDEDTIDFEVLDRVMSVLRREDLEWAILKASSTKLGKQEARAAHGGRDALLTFMLSSNYMSGMILNRNLLHKHKGIDFVRSHQNNSVCYYYPHMYWELLLCQYGKVEGTPLVLVHEGQAEKTDINRAEVIKGQNNIPSYATLQGRLEQHRAFYDIFSRLDACKKDFDLFKIMYLQLCMKTLFLVKLSIGIYYNDSDLDQHAMLEQAWQLCTDKDLYKSKSGGKFYSSDFKEVEEYYHLFKSQLKPLS